MSAAAAVTIHCVLARGELACACDDEAREMRPGDAQPCLRPPERGELPLARLKAERRPARLGDEPP
jgi:hypothetical protein